MAKLSLTPSPTFKTMVGIPVAGGKPVDVEFTFKHRTKDQLATFLAERAGKTDIEGFLDMVTGWELEDPFNEESVTKLTQNYPGASLATFRVYIDELVQAKIKN
ncbi:MAG: hypothetical protein B7Y56_03020 [Gallionellales bacterium 35-53-114]|nr:MAG: hypothetical protein B7Y56_03020 [Gallionellales bacterium 35-53-114]OYZ65079.1 MAG: hypothetical protein B7Y04_00180 [Gallionellales bacterium 24-53-125]OZB07988.1 MAG: hypothetical protein B7X61_10630 [Gallionellales bacterium 39-52-133]HQS59728.1 phage tail assembly chaperone [Gallionellaceae bacterium]HQS76482.1 phage tail assembly chaperone [Gallionellaceae bacterium]